MLHLASDSERILNQYADAKGKLSVLQIQMEKSGIFDVDFDGHLLKYYESFVI